MFSTSKTMITPATAQSMIASAFGSQAVVHEFRELVDGYFNAAYLVELAGGQRFVLKVAPPPAVQVLRYEQGIMRTEVEVLRLIRQRTIVPAPTVHHYDTSHRLVDSDYFIMSFVPGVPFNQVREQVSETARQAVERSAGECLRQLNAIQGTFFGYMALPEQRHTTWRAAFLAMMDDVLADGEAMQVTLPLAYPDLRTQIAASAWTLGEVTNPQLVHWDLWDGNIFVDAETGAITGLIDFERALWGDPLMEFQFRTLETTPAFQAGYGVSLLDTPMQRRRRTLYNLYLYLIMVIECAYRRYATDDQERWARQQVDQELARLALGDEA